MNRPATIAIAPPIFALGLALTFICTAAGQTAPQAGEPASSAPAASAGDAPAPETAKPATKGGKEFVIGPDDVLRIEVMHEPSLTAVEDVRPDGMISLLLAGQVRAAGRTPEELADAIKEKLQATIREPQVNVEVVKVNSRKYTIQGEVNRPGTYTFATPITMLEALASGLGFRDFANTKKIYILRHGDKIPFNYKAVSHGKHMEENIMIENGDQIFVP